MEFYRIQDTAQLLANVAWANQQQRAKWDSERKPLSFFTAKDPDWPNKFHTWRMDWNADSIVLYLDETRMNTTLLRETVNPDRFNPFHQSHYLLLNLAIGENGGDPSQTPFPIQYEVDYVRVYQNKP
jgi:beta-glucanase (GH16 family)